MMADIGFVGGSIALVAAIYAIFRYLPLRRFLRAFPWLFLCDIFCETNRGAGEGLSAAAGVSGKQTVAETAVKTFALFAVAAAQLDESLRCEGILAADACV